MIVRGRGGDFGGCPILSGQQQSEPSYPRNTPPNGTGIAPFLKTVVIPMVSF